MNDAARDVQVAALQCGLIRVSDGILRSADETTCLRINWSDDQPGCQWRLWVDGPGDDVVEYGLWGWAHPWGDRPGQPEMSDLVKKIRSEIRKARAAVRARRYTIEVDG